MLLVDVGHRRIDVAEADENAKFLWLEIQGTTVRIVFKLCMYETS